MAFGRGGGAKRGVGGGGGGFVQSKARERKVVGRG